MPVITTNTFVTLASPIFDTKILTEDSYFIQTNRKFRIESDFRSLKAPAPFYSCAILFNFISSNIKAFIHVRSL